MVSTSLKTRGQKFDLPIQWIPSDPRWENYVDAWSGGLTRGDFARYTMNSVIVTGFVTILNVLLTSLAGYGLAQYRFPGAQLLFLAMIATLILPLEVIMVPLFLTMRDLGWIDSYQGLIVPVIADAFGVFLMRQWFRSLPRALIDAARIDGAGHLRPLFHLRVSFSGAGPFQQAELSNFPQIMAFAPVGSIPLAVLFFPFQRYVVRGIAATGIRE